MASTNTAWEGSLAGGRLATRVQPLRYPTGAAAMFLAVYNLELLGVLHSLLGLLDATVGALVFELSDLATQALDFGTVLLRHRLA